MSKYIYRNMWHKPNLLDSSEFFSTDVDPVQIGKYKRFHVIKVKTTGKGKYNQYDYVLDGVCIAQRAGACTEEDIDNDWRAQENIKQVFGTLYTSNQRV